jgi:hypothetical protein
MCTADMYSSLFWRVCIHCFPNNNGVLMVYAWRSTKTITVWQRCFAQWPVLDPRLSSLVSHDVSRYIKMYYCSVTDVSTSYISVYKLTRIFRICYVFVERSSVFQCLLCGIFWVMMELCIPLANNGFPQRCQALRGRNG